MKKLVIAATIGIIATLSLIALGITSGAFQNSYEQAIATDQPISKPTKQLDTPDADKILELVNKEREKVGAAPLTLMAETTESAQYKADDMAERNYFNHNDPNTGKTNGLDYLDANQNGKCKYISENIRWTPFEDSNEYLIVKGWKDSKPHYDAIKDERYTKTGIGITRDDDQQRYYIVQHFCIAN